LAADFFNRGLEKSIGQFDVTHDFKFAGVYDLPFGKSQHFVSHGPAAWVIGNWRISSINIYDSGTPVGISTSLTLPIYANGAGGRVPAYVTSYDGWQPSWPGGFDPGQDHFLAPYGSGPFPTQGTGTALNTLGNVTRYNPKVRLFPNLTENMSLTRVFPIREQWRLEFRAEAFNILNRVRFGTGSTQLQSQTFGVLGVEIVHRLVVGAHQSGERAAERAGGAGDRDVHRVPRIGCQQVDGQAVGDGHRARSAGHGLARVVHDVLGIAAYRGCLQAGSAVLDVERRRAERGALE